MGRRWPDHPGFPQERRDLFAAVMQRLVVRGIRQRSPACLGGVQPDRPVHLGVNQVPGYGEGNPAEHHPLDR
jgi:hypothetical protein